MAREFTTYEGWKRAVRAIDSAARFEGDIDIANAFGKGIREAHWDGEQGIIEEARNQERTSMADVDLGPITSANLIIALYDAAQQSDAFGTIAEQVLDRVRQAVGEGRVRTDGDILTITLDLSGLPDLNSARDHQKLWNVIRATGAKEVFGAFYFQARNTPDGQPINFEWF